MTKGALYKHYKNKQDLFDSIVERMYQLDAGQSREHHVPEQTHAADPDAYSHVSWGSIRAFTRAQFRFWTEDRFACDFRRMLTLEQYRNRKMAELYRSCITAGPVAYMEDIFREMMEQGTLRKGDPKQLALAFYAPLFLLISMADSQEDRTSCEALLDRHMEQFISYSTFAAADE